MVYLSMEGIRLIPVIFLLTRISSSMHTILLWGLLVR